MAIAGSTREAFFLRLDGDRLVVVGKHRPAGHLIETDVSRAIDRPRRGEAVYLEAKGMNLAKVRGAFDA